METRMNPPADFAAERVRFRFRSESSVMLCTPFRADSLRILLDCLERVDDSAIFYHLYAHLLRNPAFRAQHQNDFARWASEAVGEPMLAEKLAIVDPLTFGSLQSARRRLVETIGRHIGDLERVYRVPPGQEFRFIEIRSFAFPTGESASTLAELAEILPRISPESTFYHFVSGRLRRHEPLNDFSAWCRDVWNDDELAEEIEAVTPYRSSLDQLPGEIAALIRRRLR